MGMYLGGLIAGAQTTNAYAKISGHGALFCPPGKLKLDDRVAAALIDQEAPKGHATDDTDIESILIAAIVQGFPCND